MHNAQLVALKVLVVPLPARSRDLLTGRPLSGGVPGSRHTLPSRVRKLDRAGVAGRHETESEPGEFDWFVLTRNALFVVDSKCLTA
jgi:hypothetical protein